MDAKFSYITKQDILNFPFPYKLWLIVNLEYCDFVRWNRDGTVVLLDLVGLEEYLNSMRSIFKIKNSSSFLQHLVDFNFDRLNSTPEAEEDVLLQYKNEHFQRHRLDLLPKIRRHMYQLIGEIPMNSKYDAENEYNSLKGQCISKLVSERMLGDLCFMCHGGLSHIKRSRLNFQTILQFIKEKDILKKKLEASELSHSSKLKNDRSTVGTATPEDQVIELPVELFENPHDSVLNLEFLPEYAGYYGNCTKDQILHFFGEYLPMYEDGSLEVKKIVTDSSAASGNNSFSTSTETDMEQYISSNISGNSNVVITTPIAPSDVINLNFSSNLEPIFMSNEDSENINSNNVNNNNFTVTYINLNSLSNEDDISMDEFLKFNKETRNRGIANCSEQKTGGDDDIAEYNILREEQGNSNAFPQMPASFKMEFGEDIKEKEENFRNFFSQYRASLNLLYDRQ